MKTGKTLTELAAEIERQANAKRDMVAPTNAISMYQAEDRAPRLRVGNDGFSVNEIAHNQIGAFAGIPAAYYDRMRSDQPGLLAMNVNTWMQAANAKRLVRTMDGTARAFLSDSFRPLENIDLAEAALPVLMDLKLEIISCELTERRLYIKCVDHSINRDIPTGRKMGDGSHTIFDTCVPALVLSNSEVGFGQLSVETGVWTRACTNLAVFSQASMKRRHTGTKLMGDDIMHLLSDETRRLTNDAIFAQVGDVVRGAFDEAKFEAQLAKIAVTAEQPIEADPVKVVEFAARKFTLNDGERGSVLANLIKGGDLTRMGLFNAVTRTAEDIADYDRASAFERLGGTIIDLPQSQWREIATASGKAEVLAIAA
jgi:hypothetical protein